MEQYAHLANAPRDEPQGSPSTAIVAGLVAAVVGGGAWAMIIQLTNYELGIVAWGLGALVGLAMAAFTAERSPVLGATAAGIALLGLLIGKVLIAQFVMGSAAASGVMEDPELLQRAVVFDMEVNSGFPESVQAEYDAIPDGDTLSDALWEDMWVAGDERVASLDETEREAAAEQFAQMVMGDLSLTERVTTQLSGFDLLWMFLALGTAWKMMANREEEELVMVPAEEGDGEPAQPE